MTSSTRKDISDRQSVFVAQLGSRMHYAVPIAFHHANMLTRFVTDITADAWIARMSSAVPFNLRPRAFRRLAGRVPTGLPRTLVRQFPGFGIWIGILRKLAAQFGWIDAAYVWIGKAFARRAARSMPSDADVLYCFNGAALEILRAPQSARTLKILEQTMAPRLVEDRLLSEALETYPGWCEDTRLRRSLHRPALYQREAAEWAAADVIVCGSQFVVDGVAEAGGPINKCVVVPYGIDPGRFPGRARQLTPGQPMNVLFVGAVTLRKGAPVVLEAARELSTEANVRMVGAIQVPFHAEQMLRAHVELTGAVPRSEMARQFDWADIFLLPSYCEGSATVTYEAMASGLPQIITANAGSYVADNHEGRIVPPGRAATIVDAIRSYKSDPAFYARSSRCALQTIRSLTLDRYRERLLDVIRTNLRNGSTRDRGTQ